VFLHANGFNALTYRSLLAPLAASLRIVVPDLRGHGATDLPADPGGRRAWTDLRDDLVSLLDALDGPPAVVAGHSMGGTVALLAAAQRPDRIVSLVLLDPVIWPRLPATLLRLPVLARMAERNPLTAGARRRRAVFDSRHAAMASYRGRGPFAGWPDAALADYVAGGFVERPEGGVALACAPAWEANNYAAQANDAWGALRRSRQAVTILKAGAGSTCAVGQREAARRPGLEVRTVEGGGHFFPMTHAEAAREALLDAAA